MNVIHITGPAGSGKSTALNAILLMVGHERCLLVEGRSTAAGISQTLQRNPAIRTVLIDDFDPARIDLESIKTHEDSPHITFYVASTPDASAVEDDFLALLRTLQNAGKRTGEHANVLRAFRAAMGSARCRAEIAHMAGAV